MSLPGALVGLGGRVVPGAQAEGTARADLDGTDLFAIIAALAWLGDRPALAPRAPHLVEVVTGAVLVT